MTHTITRGERRVQHDTAGRREVIVVGGCREIAARQPTAIAARPAPARAARDQETT